MPAVHWVTLDWFSLLVSKTTTTVVFKPLEVGFVSKFIAKFQVGVGIMNFQSRRYTQKWLFWYLP